MAASILQAAWSNPATSQTDENYWQHSLSSATTAGSTLIIISLLSNFAGHYCQIAQNTADGSPAVTGDPVNGAYIQLQNNSTPGNENYAMSVFYNAKSVPNTDLFTQNFNEGDDGVAMLIIEVGGVTAAPLAGYSYNAQTITGSGTGNVSSLNTSGGLGSSPIIMLGFCTTDNNNSTPASGFTDTSAGFTNFSNGITWSDLGGGPFANLSYKLIANPGTTPALFNSIGTDEYVSMMIALTAGSASGPLVPFASQICL